MSIPSPAGAMLWMLSSRSLKKYGGVVVGLTLDENGIPDTAEGRAEIAGRIIKTAAEYGIDKKDIIIDTLTMAVAADPASAAVTLDALSLVRERYGVPTVLGVSNVSFGLPTRDTVNAAFFTSRWNMHLSAAIINPQSDNMLGAYYAYRLLHALDPGASSLYGIRSRTSGNADTADINSKTTRNCKSAGCSAKITKNAQRRHYKRSYR